MVGFIQGEVSVECNETPNCSGSHKAGKDWDLMSFLAVFKICSGSETPECNGEIGLLWVPTPLEASVSKFGENSLQRYWFKSTSQTRKTDKYPREDMLQLRPRQRRQRCLCQKLFLRPEKQANTHSNIKLNKIMV